MTLKDWIEKQGVALRVTAEKLGVPNSTLSGLANGRTKPSLTLAVKLDTASKGAVPVTDYFPELLPIIRRHVRAAKKEGTKA